MSSEPARYHFTVAEYERMGEVGLFPPDARLELLDGEVIEMSPIGVRHQWCVDTLTRLFVTGVGDDAVVRTQGPVRLGDFSEPQPDLALLRPCPDGYRDRHPDAADILLLVEVSDSTLRFDRSSKRPLYAAAGVTELWIVDLEHGVVEVATDPRAGDYAVVQQAAAGATIAPVAVPHLAIEVAAIV